jgi:putative two-component system response regulator
MSIAEAQPIAPREVVLAVDDNEQNLQLLEEYLNDWGYDVATARDGREAIQQFGEAGPAILVLDVMMPVMDGYEACSRIKELPLGRTVPILMLTALTGTDDKIRALECGADDFLNKPINKEELRTRIRSLIKIGNLRKELDSSENIILTLTAALENKDPRSGGHIHRVASYAAMLADRLGLTSADKETVVKGALLHDVGMIGVPDAILGKSTPLTEAEVAAVNQHARMGAEIIEPMHTFRQFLPIVRWHHERADGSGYPDHLRGEQIPLEAQIVAIANRFDELRHTEELPASQEAIERLLEEARGGAHDTELVDQFASAIREERPTPLPRHYRLQRPSSEPRVLVVDDNAHNRDLIAMSLTDAGFSVLHAADGEEAVRTIDSQPVEAVVLDMVMPGQGGLETLRALRADPRSEFLPIIALTSNRNNQLRQEAIVAGADDFLSYPINRLELVTRIRSLLRLKEYHVDLEQTQNVICALALAIEAKDPYTRGHSQRVGDLAHRFAIHLGIPPSRAEIIRTAGLLHDIGKIAVPEGLLNKNGPLTKDEFLRVIDHPVIGEEMCRPLLTLSSVLGLIRHHHERYDGRGYPDGLSGEAIPYEVRLLSIVDAYDALTSHRSYRPAPLEHSAALETLRREAAGGKWDPVMVDQFCRMLGASSPNFAALSTGAPLPSLRLA